MDASLVVAAIDWVLAEFIRLYHQVPACEAYAMVDQIVTRKAPVVQEFRDSLKVLRPDLRSGETCLVLLYHRGIIGASFDSLRDWVPEKMRPNLRSTLARLDEKALAHSDSDNFYITRLGQQEVEANGFLIVT